MTLRPTSPRTLIAVGLLTAACSSFCLAQVFTFDSGIEGWSVYDIGVNGQPLDDPQPTTQPSHDATFGLPPGSLRVGDAAPETWIGVQDAVAGNRSSLLGSSISFDVYYRFADASTYAAIGVHGGNLSLYQPKPAPSVNQWLRWEFPLVAGAWRVGTTSGPVATEAQLLEVLSDLRGVYIHTEWRTGPDDTNVDNVAIGPRCLGDLNGDGVVNGADLTILLSAWGECPAKDFCAADLNVDGVVNGADLTILLSGWGPCVEG